MKEIAINKQTNKYFQIMESAMKKTKQDAGIENDSCMCWGPTQEDESIRIYLLDWI